MRALLQHQPGVDADVDPIDGGGSDLGGGATVVPLVPRSARPVSAVASPRRYADERLVLRRPLFDRLSEAGPVTTVTAPAGSGKTSVLRSWIAATGRQAAWSTVQRDERDGQRSGCRSSTRSPRSRPRGVARAHRLGARLRR
jgi:hypothetical protein